MFGGAADSLEDVRFAHFHARQFPLGDGHLLHVELFGAGVGLPFELQIAAKLIEFPAVFAGQDDGSGA